MIPKQKLEFFICLALVLEILSPVNGLIGASRFLSPPLKNISFSFQLTLSEMKFQEHLTVSALPLLVNLTYKLHPVFVLQGFKPGVISHRSHNLSLTSS